MADYLESSMHDDCRVLLQPGELSVYNQAVKYAMDANPTDRSQLLAWIPDFPRNSYAPFTALSTILSSSQGSWPAFQVQQSYVRAWNCLPEEAKAGRAAPQVVRLLNRTLAQCKQTYTSLNDLLHSQSHSSAIIDPETGRSISHNDLHKAITSFQLPVQVKPDQSKPVVAISLPNGPLLAMTVLATATYYTAAPMAHGSGVGSEQLKIDVLQSKSDVLLVTAADVDRLQLRDDWVAAAGIRVLLVELSDTMRLIISDINGVLLAGQVQTPLPTPNSADDTSILLFTSGTSGKKKLVPLSIHSMVCGIAMVIDSWGLSPSMRCLNQMPLNHVGGLIRNLFAPVMSGGSVICCSAYDANLFWDCVEDHMPTWYYASPSMHQGILEAGAERPDSMAKSQIRLVCNAAGGLLPSLAGQLRDTFSTSSVQCTVLPSYGMTECMPISTPSLDYRLEKTGTSGISVGPDISIMDGNYARMETGLVGRICVRGAPVFGGYLRPDNTIDRSCFTEDGWFDTGDMGYLDATNYLYITGRSKEVINRGGELISPFEVEEAIMAAAATPGSPLFGRVGKALAFSASHDVLQEVVGIAVVTPDGQGRACLRAIQDSLRPVLSQVKLPVVVVYMDGGLPINNNKVLRIRLAERMSLPEISEDTPASDRHFEAISPPTNTPLSEPIKCGSVSGSIDDTIAACQRTFRDDFDFHVRHDPTDFYPEVFVAPKSGRPHRPRLQVDCESRFHELIQGLDGYHCPRKLSIMEAPLPLDPKGRVSNAGIDAIFSPAATGDGNNALSATEKIVAEIFGHILKVPIAEISGTSDFFDLGGSSMAAGLLLSKLRKAFQLRLPIDVLFTNRQVAALAAVIDERTETAKPQVEGAETDGAETTALLPKLLPGCQETCSSTGPFLMLLQLVPIGLLYPMKRAFTWTIFMYMLTATQFWYTNWSTPGRLVDLVLSMAIARMVTKTVAPLLAIAFKWLLIGRYKEGLYPMWSRYHTKWWICQKVTTLCGMGVFGMSNTTRVWYYRCLGAKIGRNVSLNKGVTFGEYDLITIEDGAVLERCVVRPFAAERNTSMYLGRISIGSNAVVGLGSSVAAGTSLPPNACIGPNSSSWEAADADEANRNLASSRIPGAHWALSIFAGLPLQTITKFIGCLPWLLCLIALVSNEPSTGVDDMLQTVTIWFASPARVAFHFLALIAHATFAPGFYFFSVWAIKTVFDLACGGAVQPGAADCRSELTKFRMELIRTMMPAPTFHKLTELFGTHYESTSILARLMGAKVGKRVYWPGTGPSVQDFSLLDIGSDVVFGSRSHLVTSDGSGSDFVRIKSGAMVADRVVLLPGVELGDKTIMGSGALTKRNTHYAPETTWVGAKKGEAVCLTADIPSNMTTSSTAGRRPSQYAPPSPYEMTSVNSTSTTLARNPDSEASSIIFAEKGFGPRTLSMPTLRDRQSSITVKSSTTVDALAEKGFGPRTFSTSSLRDRQSSITVSTFAEKGFGPRTFSTPSLRDRQSSTTIKSSLSMSTLAEKDFEPEIPDISSMPVLRDRQSSTTIKSSTTVDSTEKSDHHARKGSMVMIRAISSGSHDSEQDAEKAAPLEEAEMSSSPFGRAFYQGQASYRVWGQFSITCYSTLITVVTAVWWNVPSIAAVQVIAHAFKHDTGPGLTGSFLARSWYRPLSIYVYFTVLIAAMMAAQSVIILSFLVASKWLLMGRRKQGNYDWDKSPYCQRWQLFLKLEALRRHCYGGNGILGMLTGTHWIVLYFRALGLKCGKDCALFAGGLPSLMFTEPDLLTLGDRVAVDDASLVAHINTRGKFDLNPLSVGDRSVLRSGSRLLSGARMEADTCLLEHTLVMAGDVVDAGTTSQGWPAEEFAGERMPTMKVGLAWQRA